MRRWFFCIGLIFLTVNQFALAAEFATLGPRAMGMGGAFVAVASDATAVHWNPAGLSLNKKLTDDRGFLGIIAKDHIGLYKLWNEIDSALSSRSITDPDFLLDLNAVDQLISVLLKMDKPGIGIDLSGQMGAAISANMFGFNFALGGLGLGYLSAVPVLDLVHIAPTLPGSDNSILDNDTKIALNGFRTLELSFSAAHGFLFNTIHLGATGRFIDGATYFNDAISAFGNSDINLISSVQLNEIREQKLSVDLGLIFRPLGLIQAGIVGKYLTRPSFSSASGQDVVLDPQFRAGVALKPWRGATFATDIDLSDNQTLTPDHHERQLAAGFEQTFGAKNPLFSDVFSFRIGAYRNIAIPNSNYVFSAGIGLGFLGLRADIAGMFDFENEEAAASATLGFHW